jgi:hypothetical protein
MFLLLIPLHLLSKDFSCLPFKEQIQKGSQEIDFWLPEIFSEIL